METELPVRKQKNLKLNIIFNAIYQIFVLIVPFITSPYVSRVLLPQGVGSYSLALSWVTYFSTVAAFGFLDYGTTILAMHRNDK
jgi:O-antigen/teichoic acid export membrane protein